MSKIPSCVYGYKLPRDTQQAIHAAIIADICCYDLESRQDIQRLGGAEPERDIFWTVGEVPEHILGGTKVNVGSHTIKCPWCGWYGALASPSKGIWCSNCKNGSKS